MGEFAAISSAIGHAPKKIGHGLAVLGPHGEFGQPRAICLYSHDTLAIGAVSATERVGEHAAQLQIGVLMLLTNSRVGLGHLAHEAHVSAIDLRGFCISDRGRTPSAELLTRSHPGRKAGARTGGHPQTASVDRTMKRNAGTSLTTSLET